LPGRQFTERWPGTLATTAAADRNTAAYKYAATEYYDRSGNARISAALRNTAAGADGRAADTYTATPLETT